MTVGCFGKVEAICSPSRQAFRFSSLARHVSIEFLFIGSAQKIENKTGQDAHSYL